MPGPMRAALTGLNVEHPKRSEDDDDLDTDSDACNSSSDDSN